VQLGQAGAMRQGQQPAPVRAPQSARGGSAPTQQVRAPQSARGSSTTPLPVKPPGALQQTSPQVKAPGASSPSTGQQQPPRGKPAVAPKPAGGALRQPAPEQYVDIEAADAYSEPATLPMQDMPPQNEAYAQHDVMQQPLIPKDYPSSDGMVAYVSSGPPSAMVTNVSGYAPGPVAVYAPPVVQAPLPELMPPALPAPVAPREGMSASSMFTVALLSGACGFVGGRLANVDWFSSNGAGSLANNASDKVGVLMGPLGGYLTAELDAEGCPAGLLIPAISRTPLNAIIYLLLLFWSFLGVALGADVFMLAIEFITSAERIIRAPVDGGMRSFSVLVWNPTIANLTLMALGSSAPEILLSVIEIISNRFYAGDLGPSTIVGSAAFNLMIISAVCVVSIPDGESRRIKELPVFYITASFSVFAYLWIIYILVISTPNIVDVWEGILTFLYFLLLVGLAYLADIKAGCFAVKKSGGEGGKIVAINREGKPVTADDASRAYKMVKDAKADEEVDEQAYAEAMRDLLSGPKSKAFHKLSSAATDTVSADPGMVARADSAKKASTSGIATVTLETDRTFVPSGDKFVELLVHRTGTLDVACAVQWQAVDTTSGADAPPFKVGKVKFEKYQERRFVRLQRAEMPTEATGVALVLTTTSANAQLGQVSRCDADMGGKSLRRGPGKIGFESDALAAAESDKAVIIVVLRNGANSDEASVDIKTTDGTATAGQDYTPVDTTLTFARGEMRKEVSIEIMDDGKYERDEYFTVSLSNATNGATLAGAVGEDESAKAICEVTIISDEEERGTVDNLLAVLNFDMDHARMGGSDWCEQFASAVEFPSEGSCLLNMFTYLLSLPFNVVFALPPPPHVMGGWACFVCALALIGALTALIGDLANHVGCCLGISASTTAITLVALGTSLPDTFASMSAAKSEPYADASIGNITGSNSVNVFLGLGMPWMIAAFVWASAGEDSQLAWRARYSSEPWYHPSMPVGFAVPAGSLGTSVTIFSSCAVLTLGTLMLRRYREGHELGGVKVAKYTTAIFFVLLWFAYVYLSIVLG